MDARSPLSIVAKYELYPRVLQDVWWTKNAFFSRMRERIVEFDGGAYIKEIFRYRPLPAQFYAPGTTLTYNKVDTKDEFNFTLKQLICPIVEFKEDLQIYAKGPEAAFSLLDDDLENGLSSAEHVAAMAMWGNNSADPDSMEGLSMGIGDGIHPSWDGHIATTYGGRTRSAYAGSPISGNIMWWGNSDGSAGEVNRVKFNRLYTRCRRSGIEPDIILCSKLGYALIEDKMESQYRYNSEEMDPYWGGRGFRFKNAIVLEDEYMPSAEGKLSADNYGLGGYKTAAFANPLASADDTFPGSGTATNLTPGEVYFMLNSNYWYLRLSNDPEYAFGLSGFMRAIDNPSKIAAEIKAALNMICDGSRYQGMGYGVAS